MKAWHEGFADGVGKTIFNLAKKNEFWENHISKEF
jgi:hypothetical protein